MTDKTPAIIRPKSPAEIRLTPANAEKPMAEKPTEEKPTAEKPTFEKPRTDRPNRPFRPSPDRPRRSENSPVKLWTELQEATNATGDVFNVGDQVKVRAPWGGDARVEIKLFYEVEPKSVWANFIPLEEQEGWTWKGGCIRTELLRKA